MNLFMFHIRGKIRTNSFVFKNLTASSVGVVLNLINQLVLVPFYIVYWGNELYSDWIVLSALMTIFALSDAGLNNVIQNRFSIQFSSGNINECRELLDCNAFILNATFLVTLCVCGLYLSIFDISSHMGLHVLNRLEASFVFVLLIVKVFLGMYSGVLNAIYRAVHKADRAMYIDQMIFAVVIILTFSLIVLKSNLIIFSFLLCIPYFAGIIFKHIDAKNFFNFKISYTHYNSPLLKKIFVPSLSYLSFPFANTMILQGFTMVVNRFFGADEVVLFNTSRTLCNFVHTLVGVVTGAVAPECSIMFGKKAFKELRLLQNKCVLGSLLVSVSMAVFLLFGGPYIYQIWTQGKVVFQFLLMAGLLISVVLESVWMSHSVILMSTNNHTELGVSFVVISACGLLLAIFIMNYFRQLYMISIPLIIIQLFLMIVGVYENKKILKSI